MSKLPTHHPIRILRRNRRPIAASLAAASVFLTAQAFRPPAPATTPVLVARHDLPAGSRLSAADLQVVGVAADLVPAGTPGSASELVGAVTAVAVAAREPLSTSRLLGRDLAADPRAPDNRPMPIRIADPDAAALLHPGNRIDLIAASGGGADAALAAANARLVAPDVLVLSQVAPPDGAESSVTGSLVLVSVTPEQAIELAAAQAAGRITFTVSR